MSGTFNKTRPEAGEEAGYCVIDEHGDISQGKIQLSRLDSHITFKIKRSIEYKLLVNWDMERVIRAGRRNPASSFSFICEMMDVTYLELLRLPEKSDYAY